MRGPRRRITLHARRMSRRRERRRARDVLGIRKTNLSRKGRLSSLDCAAFGLRCGTQPDGTPGCTTQGKSVHARSKRCDGNVAVGCFNGHESRVDCTAAGLMCNGSPGATAIGACFAPPADSGKCDSSATASCNGATISYCADGKSRSYFCKAMGFNKCVKDARGVRCTL